MGHIGWKPDAAFTRHVRQALSTAQKRSHGTAEAWDWLARNPIYRNKMAAYIEANHDLHDKSGISDPNLTALRDLFRAHANDITPVT